MTPPTPTILFSGHDLKFLTPLLDHCDGSPAYRVLRDEHSGHQISDPDKCARLANDEWRAKWTRSRPAATTPGRT